MSLLYRFLHILEMPVGVTRKIALWLWFNILFQQRTLLLDWSCSTLVGHVSRALSRKKLCVDSLCVYDIRMFSYYHACHFKFRLIINVLYGYNLVMLTQIVFIRSNNAAQAATFLLFIVCLVVWNVFFSFRVTYYTLFFVYSCIYS